MDHRTVIALSLLFTGFLLVVTQAQAAKPAPPSKLWGSFDKFNQLEERFEEHEWEDASILTTKIVWDFKEMLPELKKTVSLKTIEDFSFVLNALREALAHKNIDNSLKFLVGLEKLFLEIMESYEYKLPPVFKAMEWNLARALEGNDKKDFPEIIRETEKIEALLPLIQGRLKEKSANADSFAQLNREAADAAKLSNADRARAALKQMQDKNKEFESLF